MNSSKMLSGFGNFISQRNITTAASKISSMKKYCLIILKFKIISHNLTKENCAFITETLQKNYLISAQNCISYHIQEVLEISKKICIQHQFKFPNLKYNFDSILMTVAVTDMKLQYLLGFYWTLLIITSSVLSIRVEFLCKYYCLSFDYLELYFYETRPPDYRPSIFTWPPKHGRSERTFINSSRLEPITNLTY